MDKKKSQQKLPLCNVHERLWKEDCSIFFFNGRENVFVFVAVHFGKGGDGFEERKTKKVKETVLQP